MVPKSRSPRTPRMKPDAPAFPFRGNASVFLDNMAASGNSLKGWLARFVIRAVVTFHLVLLKTLPRRRQKRKAGPKRLLLTGTFYSENWIMNHLRPLLENPNCEEVRIVCTFPISPRPKLRTLAPP